MCGVLESFLARMKGQCLDDLCGQNVFYDERDQLSVEANLPDGEVLRQVFVRLNNIEFVRSRSFELFSVPEQLSDDVKLEDVLARSFTHLTPFTVCTLIFVYIFRCSHNVERTAKRTRADVLAAWLQALNDLVLKDLLQVSVWYFLRGIERGK